MDTPARSGHVGGRNAEDLGRVAANSPPNAAPTQESRWLTLALDAEPDPWHAPNGKRLTTEEADTTAAELLSAARTGKELDFEILASRAFELGAHLALGFETWSAFVESLGLDDIASSPTTPLRAHPAAELFPTLDAIEFEALAREIHEHGQREPIVMSSRPRSSHPIDRAPWSNTSPPEPEASPAAISLGDAAQRLRDAISGPASALRDPLQDIADAASRELPVDDSPAWAAILALLDLVEVLLESVS